MVGRDPDILCRHQIRVPRGAEGYPQGQGGCPSMEETQAAQPEERDIGRASRKMHRAPKPWAEPQIPQNSAVPGITAQPGQRGKQQHPKKRPKTSSPPHPQGGKSGRSRQARAGGGEGRAGAAAARGRRCRGQGVGGGWYSQGGLWSQVGAAAWGDVSLRLQIDGR